MAKKIYKYELKLTEIQSIYLPAFAEILSVKEQRDAVVVYALVDTSTDTVKEPVEFEIVGTGNDASNVNHSKFLGTVSLNSGAFMFHVFYRMLN